MGTRGQWGIDFAHALGNSNPSAQLVNWIAAWTKGENTRAKFNPLATKLDYGSNTCFNNVCVRNYQTRDQGIQAAMQTLQGNYPGYADIREGIRLDDVNRAANGLIRAPWGTSGALVQNTASLYDVRNEMLLSEEGSPTKVDETVIRGGTKTTYDPGGYLPITSTTEDRRASESPTSTRTTLGVSTPYQTPLLEQAIGSSTQGNLDSYTRAGYGILGFFFVALGGFLIIRNYVPTQQIVRTIAAAA